VEAGYCGLCYNYSAAYAGKRGNHWTANAGRSVDENEIESVSLGNLFRLFNYQGDELARIFFGWPELGAYMRAAPPFPLSAATAMVSPVLPIR
jgi:hypothetical protein